MKLNLDEIAEVVRGKITGKRGALVTGISTDTRTIRKGDLFFALRGGNFDGHAYVKAALTRGAAGVVVSRGGVHPPPRGRSLIQVGDTLRALGDLAAHWRRKFPIPVIAVTGSNGKTTTKEMIATILAARCSVLKTEGNFNNLIGLPLTLFRLQPHHQVAVLEMGMNHPGEIRRLTEIAAPEVGVVTNVGRAHLEGLKSVEGVARAKGELLQGLPVDGLAILWGDDPSLPLLKGLTTAPIRTFGYGSRCDLKGLKPSSRDTRGMTFEVGTQKYHLPAFGRHNVLNALSAIAVGERFTVSAPLMKRALSGFTSQSGRMQLTRLGSWLVINDCYNANPDSMTAALEFLRGVRGGRRVAILGEMLELGSHSVAGHFEVGKRAADAGLSLLIAVGPHAAGLKKGAIRGGMQTRRVLTFKALEQGLKGISSCLQDGDIVLVKGSRGMKMERVIDAMRDPKCC